MLFFYSRKWHLLNNHFLDDRDCPFTSILLPGFIMYRVPWVDSLIVNRQLSWPSHWKSAVSTLKWELCAVVTQMQHQRVFAAPLERAVGAAKPEKIQIITKLCNKLLKESCVYCVGWSFGLFRPPLASGAVLTETSDMLFVTYPN